MWWNEDRIKWYKAAVSYSNFPKLLASEIAPNLDKNEKIIELGCGLGYINEELYNMGFDIKGYDIDPLAINEAKSRSGLDIFYETDCTKTIPNGDTLIAIFFGHFKDREYLNNVLNATKHKLIIISNLHTGLNFETKKVSDIEGNLKELKLHYTTDTLTLPFPQPFNSFEDATKFVESYYKSELKTKILEKIYKKDDLYLLENNKNIVIKQIFKEGK